MEAPVEVDVRCSVIVFRGDTVLLVHRTRDGADDWVLPGGTPRPGESMAACAQRETAEEAGLSVAPNRIAFVLESNAPGGQRRVVDLVFLATETTADMATVRPAPQRREEGMEPRFVTVAELPSLILRPPLAGHLRSLHARKPVRTAAYLGNLWRPLTAGR